MRCSVCDKENKLLNGKCLDCYRLKAVDTAKKIKDNWNRRAIEVEDRIIKIKKPKLSLTGYWLYFSRFLYGVGERFLNKAIDKSVDRFSTIIFVILLITVVFVIKDSLEGRNGQV